MAVKVDIEKCIGCGICVDVCPVNAIKMENRKAHILEDLCTDCSLCVGKCPVGALTLESIKVNRFYGQENYEHIPYGGIGRRRGLGRGRRRGLGRGQWRGLGEGHDRR
ncbi:MAG: indolepyruvate ferredoxin oxidoreductase subunit alpha [Thermodesulfovibrionales bacterium]|uniref:indolepyruvate ferredoxin oxidoreductase subunit alpha n=1 Tax=Ignavibacterium sp. TaxID=2651167 RepID=UPI004048FF1E